MRMYLWLDVDPKIVTRQSYSGRSIVAWFGEEGKSRSFTFEKEDILRRSIRGVHIYAGDFTYDSLYLVGNEEDVPMTLRKLDRI